MSETYVRRCLCGESLLFLFFRLNVRLHYIVRAARGISFVLLGGEERGARAWRGARVWHAAARGNRVEAGAGGAIPL